MPVEMDHGGDSGDGNGDEGDGEDRGVEGSGGSTWPASEALDPSALPPRPVEPEKWQACCDACVWVHSHWRPLHRLDWICCIGTC